MDINNFKTVCIVGWAKTGISLCNLLLFLKKEIRVTEIKTRENFTSSLIDKFRERGVKFEFGGHSENFIKTSQLIILSPGVDVLSSAVVGISRALNIPCVGEIEFSYWLTKAKFIAITGTNGKTTTSYLTYRVLRERRKRVFLGGNIGRPLSSFVLNTKKGDLIVLEVSSFQLETILQFRPYVAAVLNIEPDHLDRYLTFDEYFKAKMNIFKNQKNVDWAVLNKKSDLCKVIEKRIKSKLSFFSSEFSNENFSCVYRIASIFGASKLDCLKVFSAFGGLAHRLQFVRKFKEITFINDSKATNPASTIWALKNIKTPVILIAGGKDKGLDYSQILPYLKKVKKINLFGKASFKIKDALNFHANTEIFSSLEDVVATSFKESDSGDTILFSPMCSSFDMFSDYRQRGKKFIEIVKNLQYK